MYITIAHATFSKDQEIYKKHFAKAIGNEMKDEKVCVVKMMIAKLCSEVPKGYSKSTDLITEVLKTQQLPEVNQFLDSASEHL